jgi:hypothetical protein
MATYPIDPDVRRVANRFGLDPKLLQAVVKAEGNIIKAVQCSFPNVTTTEQALDITCRSAVHAMSDYIKQTDPEGFVAFWGARWAPRGVDNDPTDLNANWPQNVQRLWIVHA